MAANFDHIRTFEDLLGLVGGFGRWHVRLFFWTSIISATSTFHLMANIYFGVTPEHWCQLPNLTSVGDLPKHKYLPLATDSAGATEYDRCRLLELTYADSGAVVTNVTRACHRWTYDRSEYPATIVTKWDLVCHRRALRATDQAVFMLGILVGVLVSGVLSDRFGRKRVLLAAAVLLLAFGGSAALADSYPAWIALRCLTAVFLSCLFTVSFVLFVEAFPPRRRGLVGMVFQLPSCMGHMTLAVIAYYCRVWWQLQLVITSPALLMLLYPWVIDESPRWLLTRGRVDEALVVLRKIARANRHALPGDDELRRVVQLVADRECTPAAAASPVDTPSGGESDTHRSTRRCARGPLLLLATPRLRRITIGSCWAWLVVSMLFYGITFNMADLSSSRYVSMAVAAALEVPVYLLTVPVIDRLGRRWVTAALFLAGAVALPSVSAIPDSVHWARLVLLHVARLAMSSAFSVLYLYSAELFPTSLRTTGVGSSSMCARLGSIAAPYIVDLLGPLHWAAPSAVFGACAASAGLVVLLLLPETLGRRLAETIQDVERPQPDMIALE